MAVRGEAGRPRVVVVGGGIAGLAAAHRLARRAPGLDLILLEAAGRLGGKILTEHERGFTIEAGPDLFLGSKRGGVELCREVGLADRLHGPNPRLRRSYVFRRGRLYPLPEGLSGLIPARLGPLLTTPLISPLGKLRMALEYFLPPRGGSADEALAHFISRRLGRELYDRLVEPLMAGIYAGDGRELSLAATFPQLRQLELEHGGLLRGILARRRKWAKSARNGAAGPRPTSGSAADSRNDQPPAGPDFLTLPNGLTELVRALEDALRAAGAQVLLEARAERIAPAQRSDAGGYALGLAGGRTVAADAVILATPAWAAADLLEPLDPGLAAPLREIPYVSVATVSLGFPLEAVPRPLDGYGYIVPRTERRPVLACTWSSSKFPGRAPEGWALVRTFLGRAGDDPITELGEADLLRLAREELRAVLGITAEPGIARVHRWPRAMPQYTLGHLDRLARMGRALTAHPRLFLAGHAYRGLGMPDCIQSGEEAAEAVIRALPAADAILAAGTLWQP